MIASAPPTWRDLEIQRSSEATARLVEDKYRTPSRSDVGDSVSRSGSESESVLDSDGDGHQGVREGNEEEDEW